MKILKRKAKSGRIGSDLLGHRARVFSGSVNFDPMEITKCEL